MKQKNLLDSYVTHIKKHHNIVYVILAILFLVELAIVAILVVQFQHITTLSVENRNLQESLGNLSSSVDGRFVTVDNALDKNAQVQEIITKDLELLKLSNDFTRVAEKAANSVVSVNAYVEDYTSGMIGTGFFITSDGYVITNYHVIKSQKYVDVVMRDENTLRAELIGFDEFKDVALLKVNTTSTFLEFGNSRDLKVGQKVIAIGNPLGLQFSVTEGVISGLKRQGDNNLQAYIQTDVPINPGNSGGPLINGEGLVIGLNTFKYVDESVEGLGFSLEGNVVKATANKLANKTIVP